MSASRSDKILGFNGLRGLSVLSVFLAHKCHLGFHFGPAGVWTFFALSGFLIIGQLHRQRIRTEVSRRPVTGEIKAFFIKRAIRIFPAYYAVLITLFLCRSYFHHVGSDLGFRYHFLYLSNYWIGLVVKGNAGPFGVLWTLSIEQQFYVAAPFLLILAASRLHGAICLAIAAVSFAAHIFLYQSGASTAVIYTMSPANFGIIALGGALGIQSLASGERRLLAGSKYLASFALIILVLGASDTLYSLSNVTQSLADIGIMLAVLGVLAWVRFNQESLFVGLLEWRPLEHLGVVSYGFYLMHNFIPNPLGKVLSLYHPGYSVPIFVKLSLGAAIGFAITFFLAHMSWTYFEKPLLGMRGRLLVAVARQEHRPAAGQLDRNLVGEDAK